MNILLLAILSACAPKAPATEGVTAAPVAEAVDVSPYLGDFNGKLMMAPTAFLRLALHVTQQADGSLAATLDSPDQGAMGIAASSVEVGSEGLRVGIASLGAELVVQSGDQGLLSGTFSQGPASIPITLEPGEVEGPRRPQEPTEPFPYATEDLTIEVASSHALGCTLTTPEGTGPFPGAVLLTGSGPQDRDEALAGHRPFAVLADALTRRGISVLRCDDRGVGASTGDFATATTRDFAVDAVAAGSWLGAREDIASFGFIGHSEGGMVAPLAAGQAQAAWTVLMAGPAVPIPELMLAQGRAVAMAAGLTDSAVLDEQERLRAKLYEAIAADDRELARGVMRQLTQGALTSDELDRELDGVFTPWWQAFLTHDVVGPLEALTVPTLAVYGGKDVQVLASQNAPAMEALLDVERGDQVLTFHDKNHLFQTAASGGLGEYATLEETLSPEVLQAIGDWVIAR